MQVKVKKLNESANIPFYATEGSAGVDLSASIDEDIILEAGEVKIIPTGIAIELPVGFEAQIRPRSGLAAKNGITVLNTPGTIDSDYRGELKVIMINHSKTAFTIENKMRIAQMVISKHETVSFTETNEFSETERGEKGFGSTGVSQK